MVRDELTSPVGTRTSNYNSLASHICVLLLREVRPVPIIAFPILYSSPHVTKRMLSKFPEGPWWSLGNERNAASVGMRVWGGHQENRKGPSRAIVTSSIWLCLIKILFSIFMK